MSTTTKSPASPSAAPAAPKVSDYYGCNVFGLETMKLLLPKETFRQVQDAIEKGERLDLDAANAVASAMKTWAMQKGATHYCHWFQPLTGTTAEKHDAFIDVTGDGRRHRDLHGPDARPGRARRLVVPVRRPARDLRGARLHGVGPDVPGVHPGDARAARRCASRRCFVSYTGHALDTKTPLLRSIEALNKAALGILEYFKSDAKKVVLDARRRAGILPDRRRVLQRAPGPAARRPHAVRRGRRRRASSSRTITSARSRTACSRS